MLTNLRLLELILILLGLLCLTACRDIGNVVVEPSATPQTPGTQPTSPPVAIPSDNLESVDWQLISYMDPKGNQVSPLPGTQISITFHQGQTSGSAGCNNYYAVYRIDGSALTLRDAGVTEMFCMAPGGIMEQEDAYLAALGTTASYQLADDRLQLLDAQGRTILTFRR